MFHQSELILSNIPVVRINDEATIPFTDEPRIDSDTPCDHPKPISVRASIRGVFISEGVLPLLSKVGQMVTDIRDVLGRYVLQDISCSSAGTCHDPIDEDDKQHVSAPDGCRSLYKQHILQQMEKWSEVLQLFHEHGYFVLETFMNDDAIVFGLVKEPILPYDWVRNIGLKRGIITDWLRGVIEVKPEDIPLLTDGYFPLTPITPRQAPRSRTTAGRLSIPRCDNTELDVIVPGIYVDANDTEIIEAPRDPTSVVPGRDGIDVLQIITSRTNLGTSEQRLSVPRLRCTQRSGGASSGRSNLSARNTNHTQSSQRVYRGDRGPAGLKSLGREVKTIAVGSTGTIIKKVKFERKVIWN